MERTSDLKDRLALNLILPINAGGNNAVEPYTVIAAGPLTRQPHSRAYRIVLVDWGHQFSVHSEVFDIPEGPHENLAEACRNAKSDLSHGSYFKPDDIAKAADRFVERLAYHTTNYLPTILARKVA